MNYSLDKFIRPLLETDKIVTIFSNLGKPTYTINPTSVSRVYVSGNLLKINLTKNTVIILDFADNQEAKQALLRLQSQFNLIKNRVISDEKQKEQAISQVQDSVDFSDLYQSIISGATFSGGTFSGGTFSGGTSSGTASSSSTLESRLLSLVQKIGADVISIKDKKINRVNISYIPSGIFSEEVDEYKDVIGNQFNFDSLGNVTIYINSVPVFLEDNDNKIAYFSDGQSIKTRIFNGSKLYVNPYLLGYTIDTNDTISLEYLI